MKKRLKPFFLLIVLVTGMFMSANSLFSLTVSATYVEGDITHSTIWTLLDSPFVVSKNITIHQGVTLTIEPGVEVRFGGNFSIIVLGKLNASGTKDKMITFTSNKDQPEAGDWGTIKFNGTEPSTLMYCSVKYANDGITIENGSVTILNSDISNSLQNGIIIENSVVEIKNSIISNNSQSGIRITGNNQIVIQNNIIQSNTDGILLTGNSTSGVNINQNSILSNTQSGIKLDTNNTDYRNEVVILNNILSANNYGFFVSSNTSTYITQNYVLDNNNTGIFYEKGTNHVAYFNDIYGNNIGMDVSSDANVTAEYNYWGDESGPYHTSLNPHGKGDPVGGDGVNLDFIFFLTASIDYKNERPIARLLTDKTLVRPNQTVMFIATASSDDRRVDQYIFDFGDGSPQVRTTLSIFVHNYSSIGTYNVVLTVVDDFNVTSDLVSMTIEVQNLTPLDVSISLSNYTVGSGEQVSIVAYVTNASDGTPVENANVTFFSVIGGSFASSSGLTNSTGYFTTTFAAPNVTEISNIAIFAKASKSGYADGSDYKYLEVLPSLLTQVDVKPAKIKSEETATVTVHVTHNGQPVANASVTVSSDKGSFLTSTGITGSKGNVTFVFKAPQTTTLLNITITADAEKIGYKEAQGQAILTVEPKMLLVNVAAEPLSLTSETTSQVTVTVTHEGTPISGATVNVLSDGGGNFSATTGITDSNGSITFTFKAPLVNAPLNITITANATKEGYVSGEDSLQITVSPGTLNVQVTAVPATIGSEATTTVTVIVTHNGTPVEGAVVTITSDSGSFSVIAQTTNASGHSTFVFNAPKTTVQLSVTVIANATKNGYISGENQTLITVTSEVVPEAVEGLPLTTILILLILIVIAAIIVVLVKLKIITITLKEQI
jgi:parallel beta-helix repeat protein